MKTTIWSVSFLPFLVREAYTQLTVIESIGLCPTDPGFSTTLFETRSGDGAPGSSATAVTPLSSDSISGGLSVTGISSSASGVTPSSTGSTSAVPTLPPAFLISISPGNQNRATSRQKRQDTQVFASPDGSSSSDCTKSNKYSVSDAGILSVEGYGLFSTSANIASQPFVPSETIQSIYAVWILNSQGILEWTNGLFLGGKAVITLQANGSLAVYFTTAPPTDETIVNLAVVEISSCPGYTGPSPPSSSSLSAPAATSPSIPATSPAISNPGSSSAPSISGAASASSGSGSASESLVITPPSPSISPSYSVPANSSFYFPTTGGTGTGGGFPLPTVSGFFRKEKRGRHF